MLLIYPPAARSTEPPLGIARLAGFLRAQGREAVCIDLCQEGIDFLLSRELSAGDTPTRIALGRRERDRRILGEPSSYSNPGRYRRAVFGLGRALHAAGAATGTEPGLADYRDPSRSPLRRADLLSAAASFRDNPYFPLFSSRVEESLEDSGFDSVGISLNFLSQALCGFAIAGFIAARWPEKRVFLGGGLVNSWIGQGSLASTDRFEGLVAGLIPGRGEDGLTRLLGLGEGLRPVAPDFSDFSALDYLAPVSVLPYNFSWGCPWKRCSFCPERAEDSRYSAIAVADARSELSGLIADYRPALIHFTDNEIAPLYLRSLADKPLGLPWYGFARFSPLLEEPDFCRALAGSGCVMLQLGLESGDQAVLDAMGKGTTIPGIVRALQALSDASVGVYLYVLFGTPSENRDAALRTRDFIAAQARHIDFLNVAIFNMPVSGPDAALLPGRPFYEGELSLYREFVHPEHWNRDRVRSFLKDDFSSLGEIRDILARTPPVFTSNHAPFFLPGRQAGLLQKSAANLSC